jgi:hypothetical protein
VALRRGAVAEVIVDGQTGIVVDDPNDLAAAIGRSRYLDPKACRQHVATRFVPSIMAAGYEAAYHEALEAVGPDEDLRRPEVPVAEPAAYRTDSETASNSA